MSLAVLEPGGDATVLLYTLSFSLFIYGLMQGTHPRTAKNGNLIAAGGMAVAVITTLLLDGLGNWGVIIGGLAVGSAVGVVASLRVQMTEMPQMVALYNGVGGGAVALIAWSEFRHAPPDFPLDELIPVLFAAVIGSVSFWGSNVAFAKLQDLIPTRPLAIPGQQVINALLLVGILAACVVLASNTAIWRLRGPLHRRADRRGDARQPRRAADRRRRHAGRDLAAERVHRPLRGRRRVLARQRRPDRRRHPGRLLGNDPDDGDGDGDEPLGRQHPLRRLRRRPGGGRRPGEERPHTSIGAQDAAIKLAYADSVVIVPGYGLAVAQAQHAVKEMADELEKRGVDVNYAIHPVAGRMPGHMNVLLAEADVPYEKLREMDDINPEMPRTDVAVVIGANDVTNPAAKNDPDSPIAGMPIIEVSEAQQVIVIKRSLSPGFAGIDNDLFYEENTSMLFADAKEAAAEIAAEITEL